MFPEIQFDRRSRRPLHDQLVAGVRRLILDGRLPPGTRLPSTRRAADVFGVSRNVVVEAYERLQLEGYLEAGVGVGTWVREELPGHLLGPGPATEDAAYPEEGEGGGSDVGLSGPVAVRLSGRGERLADAGRRALLRGRSGGNFQPGGLDPDLFPLREWARLSGRVWRTAGRTLLPYGDPSGYRPLREQIAEHLARHRAVRCDPEQIVVTTGSQHALDLVTRLLVDPGDAVLVEDPGYPGAHAVLEAGGGRIVPVPVDADGVDDQAVRSACGQSRLLYTTPSHQYPLGVTLSLERRLRLLEWARRAGAWIIEDDYDSEFRYGSRPFPSLQGLDREGRVLYVGTFSKVLAPGLRLGFLVVPPALVEAFRGALRVTVYHPPIGVQAVLTAVIAEGHLERHVARVRDVYGRRREALVDALRYRMDDRVELVPGPAGLHLTALLSPGTDDLEVSRQAALCSINAPPLSPHYRGPDARPGLLLGFAATDEEELRAGVVLLARALEEVDGAKGRGDRRARPVALDVHKPSQPGR